MTLLDNEVFYDIKNITTRIVFYNINNNMSNTIIIRVTPNRHDAKVATLIDSELHP